MSKHIGSVVVAFMGAVVILVGGGAGAWADNGGNGGQQVDGGYVAQVSVTFSGDAAPGGGSTFTVGVPATCWWGNSDVPTDPTKWVQWYADSVASVHDASGGAAYYYSLGDAAAWTAAAARAIGGEKLTVYRAQCRNGVMCQDLAQFVGGPLYNAGQGTVNCNLPVSYNFFPTGAPPVPAVDPQALAIKARDLMVIDNPQVDRNPKAVAAGAPDATLVDLPTWFWVTNPTSVGGGNGTRTVTATAGRVSVKVVAKTTGLTINSPVGGQSCTPAQALVRYGRSVAESSACTYTFPSASVGYASGFPVQASSTWNATWSGTGQATPVAVPGPDRVGAAQFNVPVAESQAITTATH